MAGRIALFEWPQTLSVISGFPQNMQAHWNLVPNKSVLMLRQESDLQADLALWGLTPQWMTDFSRAAPHARLETIEQQPMFKQAYAQRRCAIVANGFFEWRGKERKQAYWLFQAQQPLIFLAGIWESFDIAGKQYLSVAMLTYQAAQLRRPLLLNKKMMRRWLNKDESLVGLADDLVVQPQLFERKVSRWVSDPDFDGPECLMP
ncbi:SOS response-associated peptidase family protein [Pseudomonas sp. F1_0610]|uniref:SOS response-associated peptidase n=1 Tax=Pseudomonas sp. F1_0610 TaxID=3114284 RepID=UPI0039C193AF